MTEVVEKETPALASAILDTELAERRMSFGLYVRFFLERGAATHVALEQADRLLAEEDARFGSKPLAGEARQSLERFAALNIQLRAAEVLKANAQADVARLERQVKMLTPKTEAKKEPENGEREQKNPDAHEPGPSGGSASADPAL